MKLSLRSIGSLPTDTQDQLLHPRPFPPQQRMRLLSLFALLGLIATFVIVQRGQLAHAQGSYLTSWTGTSSSMPGNPGGPDNQVQEVQDFIQSAIVQPDGTIWTSSGWDEGGNQYGEYRNGQLVGAGENLGNNNHNLDDNSARSVTDQNGVTWAIEDSSYVGGDKVCRTDNTSVCITGSNGFRPNALAIANDGTLMVGDNGPDQQIKFYDVSSGNPSSTPVNTFGQQGGVWAGPTPGLTGPMRFSGIWGVGEDSSGNIYVIGNFPGGGTWMRSLQANGTMNWQLYGKIWVSNAVPDMSTDGTVVYDHNAMYHMDYTQTTPGQETVGDFPYAVTIDPWNHPDDPRLSSYTCCDANGNGTYAQDAQSPVNAHYSFTFFTPKWIFNYSGHTFMVTATMFSGQLGLWEQDGLFWVAKSFVNGPGNNNWPWADDVDSNGNLWLANTVSGNATTITEYPATGLDGSGNIVYGTGVNYQQINDFNETMRLRYDPQSDTLYIAGFTPGRSRGGGWGDVGSEFMVYHHYTADTSSPGPDMTIDLPYNYVTDSSGNENFEATTALQDIEIAGNYLFTAFGTNNDQTGQHGSPAIFSLSDGSRTNLQLQNPLVPANVGWVDTFGVTAGLRSNGEYLMYVEDDYRNKSLIYRWCPSGNCPESGSTATATSASTPTPTATGSGQLVTAINAGGGATGNFVADTDFTQGNQYSDTSSSIDTSGVSKPAPQAVYQTCRWNSSFTYTIPGLTAGKSYSVRLDWAELTFQSSGDRVFNVAINGSKVLSNFDVYASAGYKKALAKTYTTRANSSGKIAIAFTQGRADNPFINGIEIYTA